MAVVYLATGSMFKIQDSLYRSYRAINIPIFVINIFNLVQHFSNHEKRYNCSHHVDWRYLNVSVEINYDNYSNDEEKIYRTDLKRIHIVYLQISENYIKYKLN